MAYTKTKSDASLPTTNDSAIDWGSSEVKTKKDGGSGSISSGAEFDASSLTSVETGKTNVNPLDKGQSVRYDPTTMSRVADILNLVGDSSEEDEESLNDEKGTGSNFDPDCKTRYNYCRGATAKGTDFCFRQIVIISSCVGIILALTVVVGYASITSAGKRRNAPIHTGIETQQQLLEIAERVVTACSANELDENMSECQQLCKSKTCCFGIGEYSCRQDESKYCAVYAGCESLVEDIYLNSKEEDK